MVYVEGYTFTMHCTEEYDSDAYYNEITNSDSGYFSYIFVIRRLFKTFESRCGVNTTFFVQIYQYSVFRE